MLSIHCNGEYLLFLISASSKGTLNQEEQLVIDFLVVYGNLSIHMGGQYVQYFELILGGFECCLLILIRFMPKNLFKKIL